MPTASIVITCYNLGLYLEEALDSALAQTHSDFEVLLVDDGSTEPATIALLDRLPVHPRLRVLRTPNQGVARARNYGISEAKGSYILPLDADDRILPDYLAKATAILEQQDEVGFVGCHYRLFGERQAECRPEAYRLPDMLVENVIPIASVFRRSCWEAANGYCPELNSIEDWDLWISILEQGYKGVVLPELLFEYRVRPNSNLSHIRNPDLYQERMSVLYERHRNLYDRYASEVLLAKDRQFANIHSYAMWLEQQMNNWQRVAQERQQVIEQLGPQAKRVAQRREWWLAQIERVRRATAPYPTLLGKSRVVLEGMWRVGLRRIRSTVDVLIMHFRKEI